MSRRSKRSFSSLKYSLRKAYRKLSAAKPSALIIALVVLAFSIFILGGGIYDLLGGAVPYIAVSRRILIFYPLVHEQTILESVFVMFSYIFGVAGFLLAYQATKYRYKPRQASITLFVAIILIFIAYIYLEYVITGKMSRT